MTLRHRSPLATPIAPAAVPLLPAWATARHHDMSEADAAFAAGIALKSLDDLVRAEPVWAGCWRQRHVGQGYSGRGELGRPAPSAAAARLRVARFSRCEAL